jgi:hypothetical protein
MKTTIEIPDALLAEARRVAEREGVTLRALVERGLRSILRDQPRAGFRLRRASFAGQGLQPGVTEGDWTPIRDLSYEGRGA